MKKGAIIFGGILSVILLTGLVAAVNYPAPAMGTQLAPNPLQGISDLLTGVLKTVGDIFGMAVGDDPFGLSGEIFARMILFILVAILVYVPSKALVGDRTWLATVLALGVSILGTRFIDSGIVDAVLLPYSALTLVLSILLPIILFSLFVYGPDSKVPSAIRKVGWWAFFGCYVALYIWRSAELDASLILFYLGGAVLVGIIAYFDTWIDEQIKSLKLQNQELSERASILTTEKAKIESNYQALLEQRDRMIASGTVTASGITDLNNRINNMEMALQATSKSLAQIGKKIKAPKKLRR